VLLLHAGRPLASDSDAAGDANGPVDDEQFAVISRHESEPRMQPGWIEYGDVHAFLSQLVEKGARRSSPADPIQ